MEKSKETLAEKEIKIYAEEGLIIPVPFFWSHDVREAVKKVLKMIDLQIDTSEIWKNPENDDGYFAGEINGLEAAKNVIVKEFGDLEYGK